MAQCSQCHANLGCSCQLKTLSNGRQVCSSCFTSEQSKINIENARKKEEEQKQNSLPNP